jgi:hypothetical protein
MLVDFTFGVRSLFCFSTAQPLRRCWWISCWVFCWMFMFKVFRVSLQLNHWVYASVSGSQQAVATCSCHGKLGKMDGTGRRHKNSYLFFANWKAVVVHVLWKVAFIFTLLLSYHLKPKLSHSGDRTLEGWSTVTIRYFQFVLGPALLHASATCLYGEGTRCLETRRVLCLGLNMSIKEEILSDTWP